MRERRLMKRRRRVQGGIDGGGVDRGSEMHRRRRHWRGEREDRGSRVFKLSCLVMMEVQIATPPI